MKKIISLWICVMLLTACLPSLAEEDIWQYNDLNMYLMLNGQLSGDVEIPAEVDGYPVKALEYGMFSGQDAIVSLHMPDSLESLSSDSVCSMDGLSSVRVSGNLAVIENNNFYSCPSLTSITLPASLCFIRGSFRVCDNLREIRFTGVCPTIVDPDNCFYGLAEDCVIYVPDDQLDAYKAAIGNANGAADRIQPSGANAVIVDYTVEESDLGFDSSTGTIFAYYGNAARVDVPATIGGEPVRNIATSAFETYAIRYVVLPEGLETIGEGAFRHSSNLCVIRFPSTLRSIGAEAFFNAQAYVIDWNEGLEEIGARAFMYDAESILTLPSTVKTIGESAFESSKITELYLGDQITGIGARAFARSWLKYMAFDLYAPVKIADDAFAETKVTSLDLPWDSSEENRQVYELLISDQCPDCTVWINNPISGGVAEYPENTQEILTIENGVWTAYHGSTENLTIWTGYDDINVTALGDGLFNGNTSIRSFYPHHCGWFTTIGAEAFADSSVEYVELFGSITTIGREAFRNCANITELILPASITEIGDDAFAGCTGLTKLTVLCDPSLLPEGAFADSTSLTEVYAASDATDEQVHILSVAANRPWYLPAARVGEAMPALKEMPYEPLPGSDFQYYDDPPLLDRYDGYEVNLVLPREIDGVALPMLSGNTMTRASKGDNYDMELPVRSVVIPETYRELTYFGFSDCETLETVVFYAPIEMLPDGFFSGCTNLREVIFVNGVRNIGRGIFMNCPSLETVYLGEYLESIDEYAFRDEDGSDIFSLDRCILSADDMPDVDALLAAVKSDPIPAPEPTAEIVYVATPIGPEGEPYFGTWNGVSMDMGGESIDLAAMGMSMEMTLNADGTVELLTAGESDSGVWMIVDGVAMIGESTLTLTENGDLLLDEDGSTLLFTRGEGSVAQEPTVEDGADGVELQETEGLASPESATPIGPEGEPYFGTWNGVSMDMGGESIDLAAMGMSMELTLNADGTVMLLNSGESDSAVWAVVDGVAMIGEATLTLSENGDLLLDEGGTIILFTREEGSVAQGSAVEDGADGAELRETEGLASPESATPIGPEGEPYFGTWYGVSMDMDGEVYNVADMGLRMELTLNADGTVVLLTGDETNSTVWTVVDGVAMVETSALTLTEDGDLLLNEDGATVLFSREEGSAAPVPAGDESAAFVGTWYGVTMVYDGETYNMADVGYDMQFTLNADGTAVMTDSGESYSDNWFYDNGIIVACGLQLHPAGDGSLYMEVNNGQNGSRVNFSRTPAVSDALIDITERLEIKYIMDSADIQGMNMSAAMLGGYEYSLLFHEDGTVDFVMAGSALPALPWTRGTVEVEAEELDALIIDYYGTPLNVIITEEGFDMNYFDSMLLHFIAEE